MRWIMQYKSTLLKWLVIHLLKWPMISSLYVGSSLSVSDGCLTGSGSGGCCPWRSFCPSCDIGCSRCSGGQVVCPRWCVVQTAQPFGEPCGCGRWCYCTRRWHSPTGCSQLCICRSLRVLGDKPNFLSLLRLKRRCCTFCVGGPFQFVARAVLDLGWK